MILSLVSVLYKEPTRNVELGISDHSQADITKIVVSELGDKALKSFENPHRDAITIRLEKLGEGPFILNEFRAADPHWAVVCRVLLICYKAY